VKMSTAIAISCKACFECASHARALSLYDPLDPSGHVFLQ
jgi:hypothetical protein